MTETTNAPAVRAQHPIADAMQKNRKLIVESLPLSAGGGFERFARLAMTTLRTNPMLQQATPESFVGSVLTAAAMGLEIGVGGEAWVVPYAKSQRAKVNGRWETVGRTVEATFILGYQGLVKLFYQHPLAAGVRSGWVGENDQLSYAKGSQPYLEHTPAQGDRGEPVAFWASYQLTNGFWDFEVLTAEQVLAIRDPRIDDRTGKEKRDVADPEHWMERKTVLKQALKLAPKSVFLKAAMHVDEQPGSTVTVQQITGAALPDGEEVAVASAPRQLSDGSHLETPLEAPIAGEVAPEPSPVLSGRERAAEPPDKAFMGPVPQAGEDPWK